MHFFLFPRQRYPASPAQSSSPASYFPFRAIPERRSRKKIQPAPLPVFPLERLSSALPSDHRSRSRLSFASGTSQKESSPKISVQVLSSLPASSTPVLPDRQVPLPRQRPRYCLSRSLLLVPSSTMRTAKHLLLLVPRCASLCGQTLSEVQKPDGEPAAHEAGSSEKCLSQAAEKEAAAPRRFHSPFLEMHGFFPDCLHSFSFPVHHNVFFALYAELCKKRTRQRPAAPSGSFCVHPILLYSAFARSQDSCSFKSSATRTPALKPISIISSISAS